MLALVSATASLAEGQLRARMAIRDEQLRRNQMPHLAALRGAPGALLSTSGRVLATESCGPLPHVVDVSRTSGAIALPDGRLATLEPLAEGFLLRLPHGSRRPSPQPRLSLAFLTDSAPAATVNDREIPITLRHAEILTLLALRPGGLNAEQLTLQRAVTRSQCAPRSTGSAPSWVPTSCAPSRTGSAPTSTRISCRPDPRCVLVMPAHYWTPSLVRFCRIPRRQPSATSGSR